MKSYGITDVGKKRSMNQDSIFFTDEAIGPIPNLYIVADGMGGHKAGDVASKTAIEEAVRYVSDSEVSNPVSLLKRAIIYANDKVYKLSISNPDDYAGMGTTFVAAVIVDGVMYVANIGDSRLYIVNNDIRQITMDHSLVEELIRNGQLDKDKGRNHPEKNIITRALGIGDEVVPDFFEVELSADDKILLCSDGLSNMVEDDELMDIISENDNLQEAANKLVERANYYGGKDNISAVVVSIGWEE